MKRRMRGLSRVVSALIVAAATIGISAHGNNDHVRGTVTSISDAAIIVETPDKQPKTLTVSSGTTFERSGKPSTLKELKVGDRVVVDVPKGTLAAELVKFGPAAKAGASPAAHKH